MSKSTAFANAVLTVAVFTAGCTSSETQTQPTAPVPTTADIAATAPPTTATTTTTTSTTSTTSTIAKSTTVPATTAPATQPGATVAAINPEGVPAAVIGDPMLTEIPGQLIDYVPEVAANLNIDVPGQYYEVLPRFYFFIPTEDSVANPNLRVPTPDQIPTVEAYVRAVTALWDAYTTDPTPETTTDEIRAAFTEDGLRQQEPVLAAASAAQSHTEVRSGDMFVPNVRDDSLVTSCSWIDQHEFDQLGTIYEDVDDRYHYTADVVVSDGQLRLSRFEWDTSKC